jgi:hypothetical protein
MKKRIIIAALTSSILFYMLSSCYNNKEDILALPEVSFRKEIVPIVTSGSCGCHNTSVTIRALLFSDQRKNEIYYDAILARREQLKVMSTGGEHPGGGEIYFSASEKNTVRRWILEGGKDDGAGCTITGAVTYTKDIEPIYNTSCKGGTCHGGAAPPLNYDKFVANESRLKIMIASGGTLGHPGGAISLTTCSVNKMTEWINQGMPK